MIPVPDCGDLALLGDIPALQLIDGRVWCQTLGIGAPQSARLGGRSVDGFGTPQLACALLRRRERWVRTDKSGKVVEWEPFHDKRPGEDWRGHVQVVVRTSRGLACATAKGRASQTLLDAARGIEHAVMAASRALGTPLAVCYANVHITAGVITEDQENPYCPWIAQYAPTTLDDEHALRYAARIRDARMLDRWAGEWR